MKLPTVTYRGNQIPVYGGAWSDVMNSCFYDVIDSIKSYDICRATSDNTIFALRNPLSEDRKKEESDMMLTVEKVAAMIRENGFERITVTCPDGAEATIVPCGQGLVPRSMDECEYFLVYCDLPWLGDSRLEKVVYDLNRHAELVARDEAEKVELREYFEAGEADGWTKHDWDWYSDWHKDLYGYRPHGHVCGEYVRPY